MNARILLSFIGLFMMTLVAQAHQQNNRLIHTDSMQAVAPATILQFDYSVKNERIYLHWTVIDNQAADRFELEKSYDGENFKSVALVFGTDKDSWADYKFYEKKKNSKYASYRIKIIQKDRSVQYHPIVLEVR